MGVDAISPHLASLFCPEHSSVLCGDRSIARHNAERNKHIARAIVQMYKELSNQRSRLARPSSDNGSISISSSSNKLSSLIA